MKVTTVQVNFLLFYTILNLNLKNLSWKSSISFHSKNTFTNYYDFSTNSGYLATKVSFIMPSLKAKMYYYCFNYKQNNNDKIF